MTSSSIGSFGGGFLGAIVWLLMSPTCIGQEKLWEEFGESAYQSLGLSCATVGDLNVDGTNDIAAASGQYVRLFSGRDGSTLNTINDPAPGDWFGFSLAGIGDVNLDGFPDLGVGAPFSSSGGNITGSVLVLSGKDGSTLYTVNGTRGDEFGYSIGSVGDVNQDGVPDLIAGALSRYARVMSGKDGSTIWTLRGDSNSVEFGWSVAEAGDVDADGWSDFLVGDHYNNKNAHHGGAVWVFSGRTAGVIYTFYGMDDSGGLGSSVGNAGDVNADGYPDIVAGAPWDNTISPTGGYAVVYSGKDGSLLYSYLPPYYVSTDWRLGLHVSGAGDMNRDGFADFMIAAPKASDAYYANCGVVYLYSGRDGGLLYHYVGPDEVQPYFGGSLTDAGDLDGDLVDDLVIGSDRGGPAGAATGSVAAFRGDDLFVDATYKTAKVYDLVTLQIGQGVPGHLAALFLVDVNGAPTNTFLQAAPLDATGRMIVAGYVPPGLGSMTLSFKAYAIGANGKLIASGVETLTLL